MRERGGSCRPGSRRRSPCSSCFLRTDRSAGRSRWAGSDTDRCCARSGSHGVMDRWTAHCPGGCTHTLKNRRHTLNEFIRSNTSKSASTAFVFYPSLFFAAAVRHQSTHFCSPAAWRCHSNPVCSSGRPGPRCGAGRADTRRSASRTSPGPTCRCCCCTDRAGTARPPRRGFHSNQVSTRHSGHL